MLLSVIIPTSQRPEALALCLERLERQTLPRVGYEVIVTDDGGDTVSRDMVYERFPEVQWTQGPGRGLAANRNHGASLAKGDWVVFLDDDCLPATGWLSAIGAQSDVDVVEGKTMCPGAKDTPFEEHVDNLRGGNYWSCNLAVRRTAFQKLGGFDEDFVEARGEEDMEFAWRIARDNLHTRFISTAIVEHPPRAMTWQEYRERTWLVKWMLLYRLKTGQLVSLRASWFTVLVAAVKREIAFLLRTSLRLFIEIDRKNWRSKLFNQAWRWVTFPLVLPYLVVWEFRFRAMLQEAKS